MRRSIPRKKAEQPKKKAKSKPKKKIKPILASEPPRLVVKQHLGRLLLPEFFVIAVVTAIFYGLILFNLSLLDVMLPEDIHLFVLFILVSLIILHLLVMLHKREIYVFHVDLLEHPGKNSWSVHYNDILDVKLKQGFFDKLFATGTIILNNRRELKHIHRHKRIKEVIVQVKAK